MSKVLDLGLKVSDRAGVPPIEGVAVPHSRYRIFRSLRFAGCKRRALGRRWWTWSGSNRRPLPCHGSALPAAPQAHIIQNRISKNVLKKAPTRVSDGVPNHVQELPTASKNPNDVPEPRKQQEQKVNNQFSPSFPPASNSSRILRQTEGT